MNKSDIKRVHESYWANVENIIDSVNPDKVSLSDLWDCVTYCELTNSFKEEGFYEIPKGKKNVKHGYAPEYHSAFAKYKKEKLNLVASKIHPEASCILDFGSGWGRYSVILADTHPNALVYSLEYSDAGVRACSKIKEKYNLKNLVCMSFDYHNPETLEHIVIPELEEHSHKRAFCFSSHSIEQIPNIKKSFFDIILRSSIQDIDFLHLEPVGWQVKNTKKTTISRYNNNLFSILRQLESEKKIKITDTLVDFYGKRGNPATLISWKKALL